MPKLTLNLKQLRSNLTVTVILLEPHLIFSGTTTYPHVLPKQFKKLTGHLAPPFANQYTVYIDSILADCRKLPLTTSCNGAKNTPAISFLTVPWSAGDLTEYILGAEGLDWDKPVVLELNSEGGCAQVGILMGEFISTYKIHVEVVGHSFNACSMALLSSDARYIHPRAWVGFHATYVELEDGERYTDADLALYNDWREDRLKQVGASDDFIEKASVKDAEGGFYPSYEELKANDLNNVYARAYLSSSDYPAYL